MGLVTPSQVSPNDEITAASVNDPINQLAAVINGNVETANITDNSITTAKIADNSVTYSKVGTGIPVQMVSTNYSAVATGTTILPWDNTIPQNTEGVEFMTQAITPKSATNRLCIEATIMCAHSNGSQISAALFQDTTANALAAIDAFMATAHGVVNMKLTHDMTAGTTAATTFKIRIGSDVAGTITFNGNAGTAKFGGITISNIKITEYKA